MANFKLSADNIVDKNDKIQNFPIGSIVPYFGGNAAIPSGWLLCDGASYSTTGEYKDLYDVIGTTYGSGSGTFLLPNMNTKYPASSNIDNVTNYPTTHTHSGNISHVATSTSHSITHSHTGGTVGIDAAAANHNHDANANSVNGGQTPAANANANTARAINPGPANTAPQAAWITHFHNAGTGTTNVAADAYNHNHNVMNIAASFDTTSSAVAHTVGSNTFNFSTTAYSPEAVMAYFIIKY
jgi:microcystin-dependent protein